MSISERIPRRSGDRRARHGREDGSSRVAGEDAHRAPPGGRSEIGPVDLVTAYHAGVVRAANRAADLTSAGSGLPPVRLDEGRVGGGELLRLDHRLGTSAQKLGSVCPRGFRHAVEPLDEIVVELHEDFSSGHDHMVANMVGPGQAGLIELCPLPPLGITQGAHVFVGDDCSG